MVSAGVIHLTSLILLNMKMQMKKRNRQRSEKSQMTRRTSRN
jgi:hypothetical protein